MCTMPSGLPAPSALRIGRLIEWSPPTLTGATPAATMRAKKASMSAWLSVRLKRLRNGTSPTSAAFTSVNGAMPCT